MRARWASFGVGLWLILAPLILGYPSVLAVVHDIALGSLVCVGTLAALEWPTARFALALPAAWLLGAPQTLGWPSRVIGTNELACGLALLILAAFPSSRLADARTPAKMPA
jgi:hypothetical protein